MGSFTPFPLLAWVWVSGWGIFTSVLILRLLPVCVSLIFRSTCGRFDSGLTYRDQLSGLGRSCSHLFGLFAHVRNLYALQNRFDAFIHLAQRLANVAAVTLIALPADGHARGDKQRAVNGLNHF